MSKEKAGICTECFTIYYPEFFYNENDYEGEWYILKQSESWDNCTCTASQRLVKPVDFKLDLLESLYN